MGSGLSLVEVAKNLGVNVWKWFGFMVAAWVASVNVWVNGVVVAFSVFVCGFCFRVF